MNILEDESSFKVVMSEMRLEFNNEDLNVTANKINQILDTYSKMEEEPETSI